MQSLIKLAMEGHFEPKGSTLSMEEVDALQEEVEAVDVAVVQELEEAEKALEVVGALEDLAIVAQSIQEVSPQEAALIQIAADGIMRGTGVDGSVVTPAMEEMAGGPGQAVVARIKEIIKRIMAEIKKIVAQLYQSLKEHLDSNLRLANERKAQIKSLLKKADKMDGASKASTVKARSIFIHREAGEKQLLKSGAEMIAAAQAHLKVIDAYTTNATMVLEDVASASKNYYGAVAKNAKAELVKNANALANPELARWMASFKGAKKIDGGYEVDGLLMGLRLSVSVAQNPGVAVSSSPQEIATAFSENLSGFNLRSSVYTGGGADQDEVRVLTQREVISLLEIAGKLADQCLNKGTTLLTELQLRTEAFNNIVKTVQKTADVAEGQPVADLREAMPHLNTVNRATNRLAYMPRSAFSAALATNLRLVQAILSVSSASIKTHVAVDAS